MLRNTMMYLAVSLLFACSHSKAKPVTAEDKGTDTFKILANKKDSICHSLEWTVLNESGFMVFKMPYSDTSNFTHKKLYGCTKCQLRVEVANALNKAAEAAQKQNLKLYIFDCYRPYSVQVQMFETVNDERYVAKPGKGSNHNKGCAVDLSLADNQNNLLDMGTDFDDFSEKAHYSYQNLNNKQKMNRALLRTMMIDAGFKPYEAEWWHFNYKNIDYPVSDHPLPCD